MRASRSLRWAAAAVAVVSVAACSSSKKSSSDVPVSPALKAKLLTVADLPSGWAVDSSVSDTGGGGSSPGDPQCVRDVQNNVPGETGRASVDFAQSGGLPALEEELGSFKTEADAKKALATVSKALDSCRDFSFDDSGTPVKASIARANFEQVGDESAAYRGSFSVEGVTGELWLVYVRRGATGAIFSYVNVGSADATEVQQLVAAGARKF